MPEQESRGSQIHVQRDDDTQQPICVRPEADRNCAKMTNKRSRQTHSSNQATLRRRRAISALPMRDRSMLFRAPALCIENPSLINFLLFCINSAMASSVEAPKLDPMPP